MWKLVQQIPHLSPGEIHVWRVWTPDFGGQTASLAKRLSPAERERVARFHFERHRQAYLVTHGVLRFLLGRYLQLDPHKIVFSLNACGKPEVDFTHTPVVRPGFQFNISESKGMALLAFGLCGELGVDVEAWRPDIEVERLAARFFAPGEKKTLLALPPDQHRQAFFYGWTRKEAYMKARGLGFSLPLASFEVSLNPSEPPRLISTQEPGVQIGEWQMFSFEPGEGFAGALAVCGPAQVQPLEFRLDNFQPGLEP